MKKECTVCFNYENARLREENAILRAEMEEAVRLLERINRDGRGYLSTLTNSRVKVFLAKIQEGK